VVFGTYAVSGNNVLVSCGDGDQPTLAKEDAIAALLSADCMATLADVDPAWSEPQCNDNGCSMQGTGGITTVAPIATLLAAAALARHRRRRRR
jgi:hypothetical protein